MRGETMTRRALHSCWFIIAAFWGAALGGAPALAAVQTCTATNVQGNPYQGTLCGGAFIDNCTPGLLYSCKGGNRGDTNNCRLVQSCAVGCITDPTDTPVTAN